MLPEFPIITFVVDGSEECAEIEIVDDHIKEATEHINITILTSDPSLVNIDQPNFIVAIMDNEGAGVPSIIMYYLHKRSCILITLHDSLMCTCRSMWFEMS